MRRPANSPVKRLPANADALYPQFASAMPLLKQMLTSSRNPEA